MRKNNILPILIIVLSINFLSLGLMMLNDKGCNCPVIEDKGEKAVEKESVAPIPAKSVVIGTTEQQSHFFLYGKLKKEPIPEEIELGDFWYWVYFDEPHLLVDNALGVPQYVDKLEVYPPQYEDYYEIEEFIDEKVEIYGYLISGYAEDTVFQITAIRKY